MSTYLIKWLFRVEQVDRKALEILCRCFQKNQRIQKILDHKKDSFFRNLKYLMSYKLLSIRKSGAIYKSSKANSVLLYYQNSKYKTSLKDQLRYLFIGLKVVGLKKLFTVYKNERKIKFIRQIHQSLNAHHDFLYIMFLAQDKSYNALDALLEMKRFIIDQSDYLNIPIYMETTEERLVPMYARMGFKFYDSNKVDDGPIVYFAKYEPFLKTISKKKAA